MGVLDSFSGLSNFKSGFAGFATYLWVLYILIPLALIIFGIFIWKMVRDKNKQWTHKLRIRRVMQNNLLSKEITIRMRRFPLIKRAEVFELETPLLGGYLMPELDSYTGTNEFAIIIDTNNRIYLNTGELFCPDKSCVNVSAKHAEIDISRSDLRADYQNINKTSKRLEWSQIAKFVMMGLLIIAVMVVAIKGIGQWGENHKIDAEKARAEAEAFSNLADAMKTSQATMNTQVLILDLLKKHYGTENLQPIIRSQLNETI
jgi:hypothetical protein